MFVSDVSRISSGSVKRNKAFVSAQQLFERDDAELEQIYDLHRKDIVWDDVFNKEKFIRIGPKIIDRESFLLYLDFEYGNLIERSIVFGYIERHVDDKRDIAQDIIGFVQNCRQVEGFDKEFPCLKPPAHDWAENADDFRSFIERTDILWWVKHDPLVLFSNVVQLPSGIRICLIYKCEDNSDVEFVSFGSLNQLWYVRRCSSKTYRNFLSGFRRITRYWKHYYHGFAMDSAHIVVSCDDADLDTLIHGGKEPLNYCMYYDHLERYFKRLQ